MAVALLAATAVVGVVMMAVAVVLLMLVLVLETVLGGCAATYACCFRPRWW